MNSCGGRVVGTTTANPTRKPADAEPDQFPAGLRVLVVDDDPTCLKILERMLRTCQYAVTKCDRAEYALNELRRNKNGFDIVISDVHMPDMDGFKLLEHIGLEMDLPVIMMSADDSKNVVMKGVTHGACDYLIKPVRIEALKNIWQHVIRKKKNGWRDVEQSGSLDEGERAQKQEDAEYTSSANDGNWKSSNRKGEDEEAGEKDDNTSLKKARVVWSVELHQQFVAAVNQLGIDKAVPKKILEMMNVPGLTRENVASHLQKYRLYLRRLSGMSHHHGGFNASFMSPQDAAFGAIPPLGGFDLQTHAVASQLPRQTLAGYQPGLARSAIKPGMSMPFIDQSNLFSFETSKQRFAEGQHLRQMSNTNKQLNFLHGIPTTMDLKHLSGFHQSAQSLGSLTMQQSAQASQSNSLRAQMAQPQMRSGHLMNERIGSQFSQIQTSTGQNISSAGVLPRTGSADSNRAMSFGSVSQASSAVDFVVNYIPESPSNSFPVGSTPAMATSKWYIQEEVNCNGERARSFGPDYDMFIELPRQKSQDWQSSSMGSIANKIDVSPSIMVDQGLSSGQNQGQCGNRISASNTAFSTDALPRQGSNLSLNNVLIDDASSRVKTQTTQDLSSKNNLYHYQFAQDDLMSAMLKQVRLLIILIMLLIVLYALNCWLKCII